MDRTNYKTSNRLAKWFSLVVFWYLGSGCLYSQLRLGPFYDRFPLTLEPGSRTELFGPLFYEEESESRTITAVPPLFSLTKDPDVEATEFDLLYPLVTYDRYGEEYRLQFGQLLSFSGGAKQDDSHVKRFTVFPFYFQQRGSDPKDNYTALLPFYGTLKQRLFRDEISVVMWPLYVQSRKKDVVTDNYLYPFFSLRRGDGLHGWKAWPLASREHKDVTTLTNGFGETTIKGGHDKFSLLWPIYFNNTTGIGSTNPTHSVGVLPLFTFDRSPARDFTSVMWPFFNFIDDRGKQYREWQTPWPFIEFARGEGKTMSRVLPFFSTAHNATMRSDTALWPLYRYERLQSEPIDRERTRLLFFLYSDVNERNTQQPSVRRGRTDLWPLFTARRDANGNERFQLFAPLEPLLANNKSIERNWSPLWSVWRSESNATSRAQSQSFLWNLYRKDSTPESKNVSLLFGLFQYDSNPEATRWRLFHLPVATDRKANASAH